MEEAPGEKIYMSLSSIHTVGSERYKMEEAARWEDYVTQHNSHSCFYMYKYFMEKAGSWEDYVTQHNSHSWFKKVLRYKKPQGEKIMSLSTFT